MAWACSIILCQQLWGGGLLVWIQQTNICSVLSIVHALHPAAAVD